MFVCSFCQSENKTPIHLFHGCIKTNLLWYKSKKILKTKIDLPEIRYRMLFSIF